MHEELTIPTPSGPVALTGWDCSAGWFQCFQDCCQRGLQFCNHLQKRCQDCKLRENSCGSFSLVPMECDGYCHKFFAKTDREGADLVSSGYMYATCVLAVLLCLLTLMALGYACWQYVRSSTAKPKHAESGESISLLDSSQSSSTTQDKGAQTDAEEPATPATAAEHQEQEQTTALSAPPHPHPPPFSPPSPLPTSTPCSGSLADPPAAPEEVPPPSAPPLPSRPQATNHLAAGAGGRPPGACGTGSAQLQRQHPPGVCRDPRLDNVPATADADWDVSVGTRGGGVNVNG